MRLFTKEASDRGAALWDQLDTDVSDTDFIKSATLAMEDAPVYTGPSIPAGALIKIGGLRIEQPVYPGDSSSEFARDQYRGEVRDAMQKLAGFWGEAFKNLTTTLKGVIRGGPASDPMTVKDLLSSITSANPGGGHSIDLDKTKKFVAGLGKADPLAGGYRKAQVGLALAIPAAAIAAGAKAWSSGHRQRQHGRIEQALVNDPEFENQADKEQAISESYGLMRRYAPSIALDPVVSKSFVKLLVQMPDMQNLEVVQNLMEAERKYHDSGEFSSDLRDIQKLMRHPLVTPFSGGGGKGK